MKKYFITLTIAACFIMFGAIITFYEVLNFNISDEFANFNLSKKTITYDLINVSDKILIDTPLSKKATITYDNTINSGNYKIVITYYNELVSINKYSTIINNVEYVNLNTNGKDNFDTIKKLVDITVEGLKEKKVYDYYEALTPDVKVYINETDKDKILLED